MKKTGSLHVSTVEIGNDLFDRSVDVTHTLSIHDVHYEVNVRKRPCARATKKMILKGMTGIFKPGMNAILGPTGSGKSSLLDFLAGRKDPKDVSGDVLLDGSPPPKNYKCMVGYVVQDDVVMGTLTMPSSVTRQQRRLRVDQVIEELGLTECADRKVGTEFIRGVSGGERKRTNIGMELIISPPVLFLDEPTTGLDASTASSVMLLLKRMGDKGQTIVFSIHQPRYSIFKLFDNLMLLSAGETVYFGSAHKALEHFHSIGYVCEEHNNPADFFLDVVTGDVLTLADADTDAIHTEGLDESLQKKLVNGFQSSESNTKLMTEANNIHAQYRKQFESGTLVRQPPVLYATSFLTQLRIVSARSVLNLIRNPQTSIIQMLVTITFALIVGTIYFDINSSVESGIQNRIGAFFFVTMNQMFGAMSAVELFIKQRVIFIHENASGFYRVSAFFLAKVICDVVPMRLIPVVCFSTIVYWMVGFQQFVAKYLFFTMNLFFTTLAASGIAFAISAGVRVFAIANLGISMSFVIMMLFGGLLRNLNDLGDWISWIKWFSVIRYSLDALTINELKDQMFCTGTNCTSGNKYMDTQGIQYTTTWDLWQKEVALLGFVVITFILAYIQLRRIKKLS
ncbi:broad substrate specificity ATP-binding cassette transporter ABCG2-like [Gigantopelta aegis]|uniref:broad substrate specificity ATP-binding cassette transporter ABCG2-like n=1 Tax=Gigantopelta aegis TaxID=1735272 RepID=UPI001B88D192|nr:broad substrate specificity ATP-binding cassette transporter ABCG2-like [Gigantopelta aegis]